MLCIHQIFVSLKQAEIQCPCYLHFVVICLHFITIYPQTSVFTVEVLVSPHKANSGKLLGELLNHFVCVW